MKKILILEDNITTLKNLSQIIRNVDTKNIVYAFQELKSAYQCAVEKRIDLFLVDIILDRNTPGDSSGLRFIENIRKIQGYTFVPIIIVTSLEDAKLYTYENLHCYCFIEKPFDVDRLRKLIEQCLCFDKSICTSKTLYFRKDGIILAVDREEIIYAESINHMMRIHTQNGDILDIPYITLKKLLDDLDSNSFLQCCRNTIVNKKYIHNIDFANGIIQLKNGSGRVEIGITFRRKLKRQIYD